MHCRIAVELHIAIKWSCLLATIDSCPKGCKHGVPMHHAVFNLMVNCCKIDQLIGTMVFIAWVVIKHWVFNVAFRNSICMACGVDQEWSSMVESVQNLGGLGAQGEDFMVVGVGEKITLGHKGHHGGLGMHWHFYIKPRRLKYQMWHHTVGKDCSGTINLHGKNLIFPSSTQ